MLCDLHFHLTENPISKEDLGEQICRISKYGASLLWTHKNLILFSTDVTLDVFQAESHFTNGNFWWGILTVVFIISPNLIYALNTAWKQEEKWAINALSHFFFLHFITLYR